ncbi:MAG: hypothetical protein AAGD14_15620 [Planctomycetota bacterium]
MTEDEGGFSLILLEVGESVQRIVRATVRVRRGDVDDALAILRAPLPLRVATGLSASDAQDGQYEFVSCDCIAVFVRDAIVDEGGSTYLRQLFDTVSRSPEFGRVTIEIRSLPDSSEGRRYLDQFTGSETQHFPYRAEVREKKARLMELFGDKVGAQVRRL